MFLKKGGGEHQNNSMSQFIKLCIEKKREHDEKRVPEKLKKNKNTFAI